MAHRRDLADAQRSKALTLRLSRSALAARVAREASLERVEVERLRRAMLDELAGELRGLRA